MKTWWRCYCVCEVPAIYQNLCTLLLPVLFSWIIKVYLFNVIGCIAWVTIMLAGGHYLDKLFIEKFNFDLKQHLELIVLGIVFCYYSAGIV